MAQVSVQSSLAKREFGKYFKHAVRGDAVLISNRLTDEKVVLVNHDFFEELVEIHAELNNDSLNRQMKSVYADYKKGNYKKGLGSLIDIMNETVKKELMQA